MKTTLAKTLTAGLFLLAIFASLMARTQNSAQPIEVLRFEIAENASRFVSAKEPVKDGMPAYGNYFVTQGYIYPAGTLKGTDDGVNKDGSPQYPDKVIGEWTCYGTHVGEGAHTKSGPWVITTQLYSLGKPGERTIVTSGYELSDQNVPFFRAIAGGTGIYAAASGQMVQTFLGFNPSQGVNLRVELRVLRSPAATALTILR